MLLITCNPPATSVLPQMLSPGRAKAPKCKDSPAVWVMISSCPPSWAPTLGHGTCHNVILLVKGPHPRTLKNPERVIYTVTLMNMTSITSVQCRHSHAPLFPGQLCLQIKWGISSSWKIWLFGAIFWVDIIPYYAVIASRSRANFCLNCIHTSFFHF